MPAWKRIEDEHSGYLYDLSESLSIVDWRMPDFLGPVNDGIMVVASDYSGQHKQATHEAYSFLVTTHYAINEWQQARDDFRDKWLPDGRRISFKQLREPMRWRALHAFLETAATIRGNLVTFLINRQIGSFMQGGPTAIAGAFPDCFAGITSPWTIERMFRLASFLAFLTAGFRKEGQESLWISDHDEALDSYERREQFARLSAYMSFGLTRWKNPAGMQFGTTESSLAPEWAEDIAAIPDLAAGALCILGAVLPTFLGKESWTRVIDPRSVKDRRAITIGNWMATQNHNLRHVLLRMDTDINGSIKTAAQFFVGSAPAKGLIIPSLMR